MILDRLVLAPLCLSAIALASACADEATATDPEVQSVLDAAVDDPTGVAVYRFGETLQPGTIVEPVALGEDEEGFAIEVSAPSTFYFVDEHPGTLFGHSAAYALVDIETGDVTVHDALVWPAIDGEPFAPFGRDTVFGEVPVAERPAAVEVGASPPKFREGDTPCEKKKYAITIDGAGQQVNADLAEAVMRNTLETNGWTVIAVPHGDNATATKKAAIAALDELAALPRGTVGEVVIYYVGHGLEGLWLFGSLFDNETLSYFELADKLRLVDSDDITVIVDSCFSGWIADRAEQILQTATQADEKRIRVLTAGTASELALVKPAEAMAGALFTDALIEQMAALPPEEWNFDDPKLFRIDPIQSTYDDKPYTQHPMSVVVKPKRPRLLPHEYDGLCNVVGELQVQDYAREVRFEGKWFSDADGHVELMDTNGNWQELTTMYWGKNNAIAPIPMRRDGFPSTGNSPDLDEGTPPGYYLARVVNADGSKSHFLQEYLVKVELQVYEVTWKPNYEQYDYPAWQEMWHPFTKGDFTQGPTIQLSYVHIPSDSVPDVYELDSDVDADHWESEYLVWDLFGEWGYDLPPAERNIATAYDQSFPDFNYYGFRAAFSEGYFDLQPWVYTFAYD